MRKNFIANISFLLLLNLLIKPFWILGVDRGVQNALGPEVYGVYFALFNFSYLFQVILDFGINNYNNRLIARAPEKLGSQLFTTLVLKVLLGIVYTLLLFIAAVGVAFDAASLQILGQLALMQIGLSFYSFLRSNVNALHLFRTDAILSVLDKGITSILCGLVLWTNVTGWEISIPLFIQIQIAGYAIGILVAFIILGSRRIAIRMQFDRALMVQIFRSSFPYALLGFLMTAYYRTDGVMLERMLGDQGDYQAGVYASAFRLLDALSILGFLFAGLLMPMFARMLEDREPIAPLLRLGYTLTLIFSAGAGIAFLFHREAIMTLLYHQPDPQAGHIFGLLMISFIAISITYIFGSLITAHGSLRILNIISLGGFLLNAALNAALIPEQLATGSAVATVFAQVLILVAHIFIAGQLFPDAMSRQIWLRSLLFLVMVTGINFGCLWLPLGWGFQLLTGMVCGALLSVPSGLIQPQELKHMLGSLRDAVTRRAGA